jgi:hypothetical protein
MSEIMRALFSTHGVDMLPVFQRLQPHIYQLLAAGRPWSDFQWGVCFLIDMLEQLGGQNEYMGPYHEIIQRSISEAAVHQEIDLKQSGFYGVGIAAQFGGPLYKPMVQQLLPYLVQYIESTLSTVNNKVSEIEQEAGGCYDNAVSGLCKIMKFQPDLISAGQNGFSAEQFLSRWLTWLPLCHDEDEVPHVYGYVCQLMSMNNAQVMAVLPHVVHSFAVSLTVGVMRPEMDICVQALNLVKEMSSNAEIFSQCLQLMTDEEKTILEKSISEISITQHTNSAANQ